MGTTQQIGQRGEDAAVEYLRRHGFLILERNWRNGRYEIDIIARRWDELHFVEVKSRKLGSLTTPEEAIDREKFRALKQAARLYIALHHSPEEPFFDLMAVDMLPNGDLELRFLEDAMQNHW